MGSFFTGGSGNATLDHAPTDFNSMMGAHPPASDQNQFRDQQMSFGKMLTDQANGGGPNLAGAQLQQATDQNISQQMALANSQRGMTPGQAMRIAAQNSGAIQQQSAQQAGLLRMQQQLQAQGLLGQTLNQGRAGDLTSQDQQDKYNLGMQNLSLQQDLGRGALDEQGKKRQSDFWGNLIGNAGAAVATLA